jgi:hypothetical protein
VIARPVWVSLEGLSGHLESPSRRDFSLACIWGYLLRRNSCGRPERIVEWSCLAVDGTSVYWTTFEAGVVDGGTVTGGSVLKMTPN